MDKKDWNYWGENLGIIGLVIFLSSLFMAQFFACSLKDQIMLNRQLELKVMAEHKLVMDQMRYLEGEREARNTMLGEFKKQVSKLKDAQDKGFNRVLLKLSKEKE